MNKLATICFLILVFSQLSLAQHPEREDNQPQEAGSFSLGNSQSVPRSIVLIISIEVRGHPEYFVLGRKTYFAPQP